MSTIYIINLIGELDIYSIKNKLSLNKYYPAFNTSKLKKNCIFIGEKKNGALTKLFFQGMNIVPRCCQCSF